MVLRVGLGWQHGQQYFRDRLDNRAYLVLIVEEHGGVAVVNHGTDHRAQLLRSLHDLGIETGCGQGGAEGATQLMRAEEIPCPDT
jgi:hypothetical protein